MAGDPDMLRLLRADGDLDGLLSEVARAIGEAVGSPTVTVSAYRPAWHDFAVTTVHGSEAAQAALAGTSRDWDACQALLDSRRERRGVFVRPGNALLVPLRGPDARLVGLVAVDESESGRTPTDGELDTLVALAAHAAHAIESAQEGERARRHRRALEHLMRVSSELTGGHSTETILHRVCEGIAEALDFGLVVVELPDRERNRYAPLAAVGLDLNEIDVQLAIPIDVVDRFFDPELEVEGCYLAAREEALARVHAEPVAFASTANGRGPHAWNRHWLLVPLRDRMGERIGFIWADDPRDRLVPTRERLQALRLFADQAAAALESARLYDAARQELDERRQAETALRTSQELYRRVVEHSTDLIFLLDLNGRFLYASPSAAPILGYEPDELTGKRLEELIHPEDLATAEEAIASALAARPWQPKQARVRHADGRYLVFEGVPVAVHGEDGRPEMILAITRDVTERRRAEEERRSLEDQLRQAQKMEAVGRLAGGIAHDFNNLLTAIGGYGQLALGSLGAGDSRARRHLEEMLRGAERAAALTRQLLAFSRKQVLQPRMLDLNEVVRDVESMLSRLIGSDVELVTSLAPDLGRIHADPSLLEQVVVNLAVNARDAMPRGGRLLIETANTEVDDETASRYVGASPGSYVALTVADDGNGMDAETLAHVFEPFFTTKGPGHGTGLGLSTVYGIVKQSSGYVAVESAPGRGTTVTAYLPRAARIVEASSTGGASSEAVDGRGTETVLLVEDEEIVRSLVEEMLAGLGYAVEVARDGEEALERIAAGVPADLVITDLVMPKLSGRELAQRLGELRPGTPVLFISGYTGDTTAVHGPLPAGTAFLEKPFSGAELAARVRAVLDAASGRRRDRPAA